MRILLELDGEDHEVFLTRDADIVRVEVDGQKFDAKLGEANVVELGDQRFTIQIGERHVTVDGHEIPFRIHEYQAGVGVGDKSAARGARIKPPMPGKIVTFNVSEGDEVQAGQVLLILEAMKMQNEITAPTGGTVKKVHVKVGQNVEGKDVLVEIE